MSSDGREAEEQARGEQIAALRDLQQHHGWQLLVRQVAAEWGSAGFGDRMREALLQVPQGPDRPYEIAHVADRVEHTKAAIDAIMDWPRAEIARLTEQKPLSTLGKLRRLTTRS